MNEASVRSKWDPLLKKGMNGEEVAQNACLLLLDPIRPLAQQLWHIQIGANQKALNGRIN
jgi:hypothetical protein